MGKQQLHHTQVSFAGCYVQCRDPTMRLGQVHIDAWVGEQQVHHILLAPATGEHEGGIPNRPYCICVNVWVLKQQPHAICLAC
mmetsp:Transcript_1634/g.3671  ORF Transcript_1634/g.3671 Transcript_1634/m.3671 type:complete len:83 (+) Transcript_1634:570-818(+)